MIRRFWDFLERQLGRTARAALAVLAIAVVVATALFGWWATRSDYQVLFADLAPQDIAAMSAELDRLKIPYVLSDAGGSTQNGAGTLLVDRADVYKTRIKLMGRDIPLHGTVGFELFNASDLGMTEFAQKINYQRALQGELTRTILSLSEIRDARVLLALPEQGLFKQAAGRPTASVTLGLKPGLSLRGEQVSGIQRLVAAAVPGILAQDVTLIDQSGVALSRASGAASEGEAGTGASRLDLKKDTEAYLSRKASAVLAQALGPEQALASVDVTLDMDRVQSHTDEVVGAPARPGAAPTGTVSRERETSREMAPPLSGNLSAGTAGNGAGSSQREVEYALGHRVEQVIGQPGSVRRIQVAVVVRKALAAEPLEQLRRMVAASVGASPERGDTVMVQTLDALGASAPGPAQGIADMAPQHPAPDSTAAPGSSATAAMEQGARAERFILSRPRIAALIGLFVLCLLAWRAYRRGPRVERLNAARLSEAQREDALAKIRLWMQAR